jgi:hypothetical protein
MNKINLVLLSGVCVLTLSSCSWLSDWPPNGSSRAAAPAPAPQTKVMQTADSTWIAPQEGQAPVEHMVPKQSGGNVDMQKKMDALEQQMAQMRTDMSMMMPALTRLAEVQGDLQALLSSQIQPAAGDASGAVENMYEQQQRRPQPVATSQPTSMVAPQSSETAMLRQQKEAELRAQLAARSGASTQPTPVSAPSTAAAPVGVTPQQRNTIPVTPSSGAQITSIRFGEHPDKTRIVLDVSEEVAFDYDVDNGEQIVILELDGDWSGIAQRNVSDSAMVSAYSASPDGQGGTRMALQLKQPGQISWAQYIPPSAGKGHRVVIDVAGI